MKEKTKEKDLEKSYVHSREKPETSQLTKQTKSQENKINHTETMLRTLLWLNHGCHISDLYYDDGELQCNKCKIDFKRDSVEFIEKQFYKNNMKEIDMEEVIKRIKEKLKK